MTFNVRVRKSDNVVCGGGAVQIKETDIYYPVPIEASEYETLKMVDSKGRRCLRYNAASKNFIEIPEVEREDPALIKEWKNCKKVDDQILFIAKMIGLER